MNNKTISTLINGVSMIVMIAGIFGMLFTFPFLWSARIEDLVGAGFPFVGSSILFGTGLISIAVFNKRANE